MRKPTKDERNYILCAAGIMEDGPCKDMIDDRQFMRMPPISDVVRDILGVEFSDALRLNETVMQWKCDLIEEIDEAIRVANESSSY